MPGALTEPYGEAHSGARAAPANKINLRRRGVMMHVRVLYVFLVAMLALPLAELVPSTPAHAGLQFQEPAAPALAAKKKKKKQPTFTTVTRTVRESVTQTITNSTGITIPEVGKSNPYPSSIVVSGFANGTITDVNLTIKGFGHNVPDDVDILLAASQIPGQNAIVMSDSGGFVEPVSDLTITLDDQAAADLPTSEGLDKGPFRPTNNTGLDQFPDAPTPTKNVALGAFNGANPNGTWQLFVVDGFDGSTADGDSGTISGGWSLTITAQVDKQITEQVPVEKKAKKKKKKR
jgi:hypothetical protein